MTNKTITVTNQKGGAGKTTTAVALAHGFARWWPLHETWLVDFDPQGHASIVLGRDPESGIFDLLVSEQPLGNVLRYVDKRNLRLLPGNTRTRTAEAVLRLESNPVRIVADMRGWIAEYDCNYTVIDTPPGGLFQEVGVRLADVVVIPTQCETLGLDGVAATMQMLEQLQTQPQVIILPTMFDSRLTEHNLNLATLREAYDDLVADPIPARVAVKEAVAYGATIWEYGNGSMEPVRNAYNAVIERIEGN